MSKTDRRIEVNNNMLTKEEQDHFLRHLLPACQPQEGSPANTFTQSELDDLQKAVGRIKICDPLLSGKDAFSNNKVDIRDVQQAFNPPVSSAPLERLGEQYDTSTAELPPNASDSACIQSGDECDAADNSSVGNQNQNDGLYWHGAPRLHEEFNLARAFRERVRTGSFTKPTNGVCPGFLQCNLVVLPQGPVAFDFLLFCQRNPKACPLIEVCDVGSANPTGVAPGADLRTDVPKYSIYRNGKLDEEVTDVTNYWPQDSVAFLIGCSFSYDGALMNAGIPLKSARQGKNVPMYKTNLKCRSAGSLSGNMVVSMKPIPALQISKHIEITSKYTHAHGGPVAVGSASAIGIDDIDKPKWGESIDVDAGEVPVFHACGVTPQSVLVDSKVPFAITHSAGHMFVTDLPSDMGI
mmetsp:Transcript_26038/g.55786  ORF Transcript_26038/g.55786 Transcript_26038/m.55786 type:complete len:409 (+) Transcript_26038:95-1321(+)|eukprot:CAMPEP_0201123744 /NCGR_PEP_ID=MMETSP0850-20130426/9065_1 /ASSEMBLY_ACC=CAM_ASM_000622 /TAXON_ID=183588 /ORGANISM="Pseudo-nitzschia fraudulenta, Strain WWA7" /LENGTH=408 /DNA_ID=CAMNT_0047390811 /DNA_START=60 /DNA_END=1286 /DNA_ORIENTATION=+